VTLDTTRDLSFMLHGMQHKHFMYKNFILRKKCLMQKLYLKSDILNENENNKQQCIPTIPFKGLVNESSNLTSKLKTHSINRLKE